MRANKNPEPVVGTRALGFSSNRVQFNVQNIETLLAPNTMITNHFIIDGAFACVPSTDLLRRLMKEVMPANKHGIIDTWT